MRETINKPENEEHVRLLKSKLADYKRQRALIIRDDRLDTRPEVDRVFFTEIYAYYLYAIRVMRALLTEGCVDPHLFIHNHLEDFTDGGRIYYPDTYKQVIQNVRTYADPLIGMDALLNRLSKEFLKITEVDLDTDEEPGRLESSAKADEDVTQF